jgi:hypothetical protein
LPGAALIFALSSSALAEDPSGGVAFGATCDVIKRNEKSLGSTLRGELKDENRERFKGRVFLLFDGTGFGRKAKITYDCDHPSGIRQ